MAREIGRHDMAGSSTGKKKSKMIAKYDVIKATEVLRKITEQNMAMVVVVRQVIVMIRM